MGSRSFARHALRSSLGQRGSLKRGQQTGRPWCHETSCGLPKPQAVAGQLSSAQEKGGDKRWGLGRKNVSPPWSTEASQVRQHRHPLAFERIDNHRNRGCGSWPASNWSNKTGRFAGQKPENASRTPHQPDGYGYGLSVRSVWSEGFNVRNEGQRIRGCRSAASAEISSL